MRPVLVASLFLSAAACAHAPDAGPSPTSEQLQKGTLLSGGRTRTFVSFVPQAKGPGLRPLVVTLHGRYGDGAGQDKLTGFSRVAAREGFVLVAPDGIDRSWADARGSSPASKKGIDDLEFLSKLIDFAIATWGVDPKAVYLTGMSNGALMSLTAACGLSEKLAAVVAVTGLVAQKLADCQPKQPLPVAFILGEQDPLVPYLGGPVAGDRGEVLSAEASAALWRKLDGCTGEAEVTPVPDADPSDGTTTSLSTWQNCAGNSEVAVYTVRGGGHTWPGGWQYLGERLVGRTSKDFSASDAAWDFFKRHRR